MKKVIVHFYYGDYMKEKEVEYKEQCGVKATEEGLVYITADGELKLSINKDRFVAVEKIE